MCNGARARRDTGGHPVPGIGRLDARADNGRDAPVAALRTMRIGDPITWQGRQYILRGLDPMGIPDRWAELEDVETGERIRVPVAALEQR